ncbi:MAG: lpg1661 family Dot/Icm T4SS effector [Gemmatimonadaceae bacterium]
MSGDLEAPASGGAATPLGESRIHPAHSRYERLLSLDVFRGLTIAAMLLVNDPGSWAAIYPPLEHAEWNGWTPTDLIFPFFLFIVGITTHLSIAARRTRGANERALARAVLRRGALIFLLGFLLNAFPFFWWGGIDGVAQPTILDRVVWRWEHLRFLGVLQRIGIVYTIGGLIYLRTTIRQQAALLTALLVGYWVVVMLVPVPDSGLPGWQVFNQPARTLEAWVDRLLLGVNHLYVGSKTYDPEGILSSVPAIGTMMGGLLAGHWLGKSRPLFERISGLFAVGAIAMMAGLIWHWVFPINKQLWTSSYVVFTGGMAAVTLATCMWIVDARRLTWWTKPFVIFGVNPIVAFVGSGLVARCIYSIFKAPGPEGTTISLQAAIFDTLFASWLPARLASLAFAIAFVTFFLAILTALYRRNIILKV